MPDSVWESPSRIKGRQVKARETRKTKQRAARELALSVTNTTHVARGRFKIEKVVQVAGKGLECYKRHEWRPELVRMAHPKPAWQRPPA